MDFHFTIIVLRWTTLAVAIGLFIFKTIYILNIASKNARFPRRFMGWYNLVEIDGTTTPHKRRYMQHCNLITLVAFISLAIFAFCMLLPE